MGVVGIDLSANGVMSEAVNVIFLIKKRNARKKEKRSGQGGLNEG
jgi:hypothetical protein